MINWKCRTVHVSVGKQVLKLPVVGDIEKSMRVAVKTRPCATTCVDNSFSDL